MLRAEALRYEARGRVLLDGVTLSLAAGPPSFVIGPNGAGKSVLLRLLHGLLRPTGGEVRRAPGLREAMLFQKPVLLRRSVARNIAHALELAGLDDEGRIARSLDAVGLLHLAHRPARRLSGGLGVADEALDDARQSAAIRLVAGRHVAHELGVEIAGLPTTGMDTAVG